jgi:hypothetical protein
MHTTLFFPNPLSESEELQSWGCSKILDVIQWSVLTKSATAAMFTSVQVGLEGHLSRHLLPASFRLEIKNTT